MTTLNYLETVSRYELRVGDEVMIPNSGRCVVLELLDYCWYENGPDGVKLRNCWTGCEFSYSDDSFSRFTVA